MSLARRLAAHQAHAISRRCAGRCFFLLPTAWCRQLIGYCFGLACEKYPFVALHALVAMTNHLEAVATDTHSPPGQSQVPRFFGYAHSLIAKAMNHRYGRGENFWAPGSYRNLEIHDEPALLDRLVYALANPAAADLVETLDDWPGLHFGPEAWGESVSFDCPEGAFFGGRRERRSSPDLEVARRQREEERRRRAQEEREARQADREAGLSKEEARQAAVARRERRRALELRSSSRDRSGLAPSAKLRFKTPPTYADREEEAIREVQAHLRAREAEHRARREREGKSVLGREGALAVDPFSSAGSTEADYSLTPVIACKDPEKRKRVLKCLTGWRRRYREVREQWPKRRNQKFPTGTYQMAVLHGAKVMSEEEALQEGLIAQPTGPPGRV